MAGSERLRLFCALRLDDDAVGALAEWQERELRGSESQGARIVPPGNLHVTLAFLGSRPAEDVPVIARELRAASRRARPAELRPVRYRETRSVGMLVLEDADGAAAALADDLQARLERRGLYRRERRPWLPHVTVLRFRERAGLAPSLANMRSLRAVRSAVYRSSLGAGGARYEALATEALGGR